MPQKIFRLWLVCNALTLLFLIYDFVKSASRALVLITFVLLVVIKNVHDLTLPHTHPHPVAPLCSAAKIYCSLKLCSQPHPHYHSESIKVKRRSFLINHGKPTLNCAFCCSFQPALHRVVPCFCLRSLIDFGCSTYLCYCYCSAFLLCAT